MRVGGSLGGKNWVGWQELWASGEIAAGAAALEPLAPVARMQHVIGPGFPHPPVWNTCDLAFGRSAASYGWIHGDTLFFFSVRFVDVLEIDIGQ